MYLYIWGEKGEIWKTLGPLVLHCWPNVCNAFDWEVAPCEGHGKQALWQPKLRVPWTGTWACWWKTFVKAFRHCVGPLSTLWVWKTLETTPRHLLLKKSPAHCRIGEPNLLVSRKRVMGLSSLSSGDPDQPCTEPVSEQKGGEEGEDFSGHGLSAKRCGDT